MHQESSANDGKKLSKRFGGQRRSYADTFRWGFVQEDSDEVFSKKETAKTDISTSGIKQAESRRAESKKAMPKRAESPKNEPKVTSFSPSSARMKDAGTKESNRVKEAKRGEEKPDVPATKQHSSANPSVKRPAKGRKTSKVTSHPYVTNSPIAESELDEDLRLPSYGRTPIPKDEEFSIPKKAPKKAVLPSTTVTRPPKISVEHSGSESVRRNELNREQLCREESGRTQPIRVQPRREQMVWDPDKLEYVPLYHRKPEPPDPVNPLIVKQPKSAQQPKQEKPVKKETYRPEEKPVRDGHNERQKPSAKPTKQLQKQTRQERTSKKPPYQMGKEYQKENDSFYREESHEAKERFSERKSRYGDSRRGDVPKFVEPPHPDPADIEAEVSGFAELGVSDIMLEALKIVQYIEPTPIQAGVFKKVQTGTDVMGQAQTGTGKTAAFVIPIIEGIETCPPGSDPVALILVPTRELAVQVRDEALRLSYGREIHITACYGGKPLAKQIERLRSGIDIIVGTPGRILDLMNRRALSLDSLRWVVLDEADRMLDIGFRPDIEKILRRTPPERQTLLFSATLPQPVVRLAERYMKSPEVLDFSSKNLAVDTIEQFYITIDPERKFDALVYLLNEQQPKQAIIFTRTKRGADRLARLLAKQFEQLAVIHGDLQQNERDRVMTRFRAGSVRYLVATDVVGRGIDVSSISHIINYDIPKFCDDYVHRVGRTGRMGREGVAFTFVTVQEGSELTRIEMRIDKLLQRAELKGFETFTKPHDPNATLDEEPQTAKPVFGKPVRKVRRAL